MATKKTVEVTDEVEDVQEPEEEAQLSMSRADLETMLAKAADAAVDEYSSRITDPATRPSFGEPTNPSDESPVLVKGYLPAPLARDPEGKLPEINILSFPR